MGGPRTAAVLWLLLLLLPNAALPVGEALMMMLMPLPTTTTTTTQRHRPTTWQQQPLRPKEEPDHHNDRRGCNPYDFVRSLEAAPSLGAEGNDDGSEGSSAAAAAAASAAAAADRRLPLRDCVCLVTGASRGIGKGIAVELGRAGATVYVTGTSTSTSTTATTTSTPESSAGPYATSETVGGPGTVEITAQLVTDAGGRGVAVRCNHAVDDDVQQLFRIIQVEHGRLDLLVNNAFRAPGGPDTLFGNFWEQGAEVWDCLHTIGLRSHYVASCLAVPLLLQSRNYWEEVRRKESGHTRSAGLPRPLIVMISSFGGLSYAFNVAYGVAKAGVDRLAKDMAVELKPHDVGVVSLYPGVVQTERTELAVQSGDWQKHVKLPLDNCESPEFTGRAVVALALDPHNLKRTGSCQVVAELAEEYGFTDTNGQWPPSIRSLKFLLPTYGMSAEMRSQVPPHLIPDWKVPFWVMARGAPPPPRAD